MHYKSSRNNINPKSLSVIWMNTSVLEHWNKTNALCQSQNGVRLFQHSAWLFIYTYSHTKFQELHCIARCYRKYLKYQIPRGHLSQKSIKFTYPINFLNVDIFCQKWSTNQALVTPHVYLQENMSRYTYIPSAISKVSKNNSSSLIKAKAS